MEERVRSCVVKCITSLLNGIASRQSLNVKQLESETVDQLMSVFEDVMGLHARRMDTYTDIPPSRLLSHPVEDQENGLFDLRLPIIRPRSGQFDEDGVSYDSSESE
jgi:hypothetical protein